MDDHTQRAIAYYNKHLVLVKEYAKKKRMLDGELPKPRGRPVVLTDEERAQNRRASRIAYYYRKKAKVEVAERV